MVLGESTPNKSTSTKDLSSGRVLQYHNFLYLDTPPLLKQLHQLEIPNKSTESDFDIFETTPRKTLIYIFETTPRK